MYKNKLEDARNLSRHPTLLLPPVAKSDDDIGGQILETRQGGKETLDWIYSLVQSISNISTARIRRLVRRLRCVDGQTSFSCVVSRPGTALLCVLNTILRHQPCESSYSYSICYLTIDPGSLKREGKMCT